MPTGYLDTNLVSGLVKEDLGTTELEAFRDVLRLRKRGHIDFRTSSVTAEELNRIPPEVRNRHEDIYMLLDDIPLVAEQIPVPRIVQPVRAGRPMTITPAVLEEGMLTRLKAILPDENDARHIYQAVRNGIDYFVTRDERTIIRHAADIETVAGIKVRLPSQLLAELTLSQS
jgi:hypothetical protein